MIRRLLRSRVAAAVVVLALAVGLGFEIAAVLRHHGLPTATAAESGVARDFAVAVTSFDYRHIDADKARILGFASATFRPDLLQALPAQLLGDITTNKRLTTGTVVAGPAVQGTPAGGVVFLVVLNQQISSDGSQSAPQAVRVAMLVTVTRGPSPKVSGVRVL